MDLNELQSVRDRERQTDKLQQLRESFYADAGKFIQQLHAERDRAAERVDDPFDAPEVNRLTDEINTAEQTVEAIYEKRVGKIVKAASFAAADLPAEADGMTVEEQELFDELVGNIKANRQRVLDVLDKGSPAERSGAPHSDTTSVPESGSTRSSTSDQQPRERTSPPETSTETQESHVPQPDGSGTEPDHDESAGRDRVNAADVMGADDGHAADPTGTDELSAAEAEATRPVRKDGGTQSIGVNQTSETPSTEAAEPSTPRPESTTESGTVVHSKPATESGTTTSPGQESDAVVSPRSTSDSGDGHSGAARENHSGDAVGERSRVAGREQSGIERQRVHVLDDIETFVGFDDRDYDLDRNDVVTLPATNAEILVEQGVAKQLE